MKNISTKFLTTLIVCATIGAFVLVHAPAEDTTPSPAPAPATDTPKKDSDGPRHHRWDRDNRDNDMSGGPRWKMDGRGGDRGRGFRCGGGRRNRDSLMSMTAGLRLTDDQKAKIQPVVKAEMEKIKAIREAAQAQIKALISSDVLQIVPMLTPEQQTLLADRAKLQADEAALKAMQPTPAPDSATDKK